MRDKAMHGLVSFVEGLTEAGISYRLDSVRDAIMVVIACPDRYIEAEFFVDGRVEVEYFGPPSSDIVKFTPAELLDAVIGHMAAECETSPLDSKLA